MNLFRKIAASTVWITLLAASAIAQSGVQPTLVVKDAQATSMYEVGQTVTFTISIENANLATGESDATYRILSNGVETQAATKITASPTTVTAPADKPGFVSCEVTVTKPNKIEQVHFVGVEPQKLKAQASQPADFMAYWQAQIARLKNVPMNPVVKEVAITQDHLKKSVKAYDIRIDGAGGTPVTAYLAMPSDASAEKRYPIRVSFHGHSYFPGGSNLRTTEAAIERMIFLDVNPFGVANGESKDYYKNTLWQELRGAKGAYPYRNWENRDEVFFNGIFLRVVRALEYAKTRPEWDGRNLLVEGSSMGGAQALVGAALDPQVSACVANVPAMGDLLATTPSWPFLIKNAKVDPALIRQNAPYYDTVNFARQIKAPTLIGVGLNDPLCPPPTIWGIFNSLQGPKEIVVSVEGIHNWNPEMRSAYPAWIKTKLK